MHISCVWKGDILLIDLSCYDARDVRKEVGGIEGRNKVGSNIRREGYK